MGNCCKSTAVQNIEHAEYFNTAALRIKERDKKGNHKGLSYVRLDLTQPRDQDHLIFDLGPYQFRACTSVIPGQDPRCEYKKECQDSSGFACSSNIFFAVLFDGHGKEGHKVSQFCKDFMLQYFLQNTSKFQDAPEKSIEEVVEKADSALKTSGINCSFSGSTAVVLVLLPTALYIGSLGDSRGILATLPKDASETSTSSSPHTLKPSRALNAVPLTIDQKPNHEEELKRIRDAGGIVERVTNNKGVPFGPYRIWRRRGNGPGLAMSRSMGDTIAHEIGVVSVPIVSKFEFYPAADQFIIIASDGIWDAMQNIETVNFVERFRNVSAAGGEAFPATVYNSSIARLLCEEARVRWMKIVEEEDVMIDDISCIVVELSAVEPKGSLGGVKMVERILNSRNSLDVEGSVAGANLDPVRRDIVRGSIVEASDEEIES